MDRHDKRACCLIYFRKCLKNRQSLAWVNGDLISASPAYGTQDPIAVACEF